MGDDQGATPAPETRIPPALRSVVEGMRSNPHVIDVSTTPLFTADECAGIVAALDDGGWDEMTVVVAPDHAGDPHRREALPAVRRGRIRAVPGGDGGAIATRVAARVLEVNHDVYRFHVVGLEPMRVLRYGDVEQGHYVPHTDVGPGTSLRKLSFSVLLSDPATYAGGDLGFAGEPFALAREQGVLTVFPSFLQHGVSPVTAGVRYAIVGFVIGPTFR